ncbi:MAG: propionyl-CoA synthetase [Boseongicola sp. SB0670_bin_30]|nr:propionyl-CoA synthetase [Boseongicola sp. SB0670_bin_30]
MSRYSETYAAWQADPEEFWTKAAQDIDWFAPAARAFVAESGVSGRWFEGAICNTCHNCVDRHVEAGHGNRLALIHDSPVTDTVAHFTYGELKVRVGALAAVLRGLGVCKGDRVVIYMPMVPEAVFAMLACARLGAIHSVVFGGFAPHELASRIDDATPKVIVSASCGIEPGRVIPYKPLLDEAIAIAAHDPEKCLILQREALACELRCGRDVDYAESVDAAVAEGKTTECVPVAAIDPLYILYTSGTTGQPKGVVRDTGGHMVALKWTMENHYGVKPGEVFWAASDVGWVVGHSYICYGPLLHGAATVVYEGKPVGTPDAGAFWRVIQDHRVVALFTAPTAFRAIRKEDPNGALIGRHDLSRFRTLFLAGERSDAATIEWAQERLQRPVIDHWWQTETGWAMSGNPVGLGTFPVKPGSPGKPMPGYDVRVLDDDGHEVAPGTLGNIVCKLPLPPSGFPTLWQAPERYISSYLAEFPGYYATSDAGIIDDDGYVFIMARTDDIINVAGHRLSTGAMEEVVAGHPDVAECAVVGIADEMRGQVPIGSFVLNAGVARDEAEIERELVAAVRARIGAVAAFRSAIRVPHLPKTRSGKVLRGTMRKIADREEFKTPAAIDDAAVLEEIANALKERGVPEVMRS